MLKYIFAFSIILALHACKGVDSGIQSAVKSEATPTHTVNISLNISTLGLMYTVKSNAGGMEVSPLSTSMKQVADSNFTATSVPMDKPLVAGSETVFPKFQLSMTLPDGAKCESVGEVYPTQQNAPLACTGGLVKEETSTKPVDTEEAPSDSLTTRECTGPAINDYLICRYFDGGLEGCLDEYLCKVTLTPAQCQNEITRMSGLYAHTTSWDCTD